MDWFLQYLCSIQQHVTLYHLKYKINLLDQYAHSGTFVPVVQGLVTNSIYFSCILLERDKVYLCLVLYQFLGVFEFPKWVIMSWVSDIPPSVGCTFPTTHQRRLGAKFLFYAFSVHSYSFVCQRSFSSTAVCVSLRKVAQNHKW